MPNMKVNKQLDEMVWMGGITGGQCCLIFISRRDLPIRVPSWGNRAL